MIINRNALQRMMPWIIWGIAACFVLLQFLVQASTSIMIPELSESFSITPTQVALLSSAYYYSYVFLQMPAGVVVDRLGARKLLLFGTVWLTVLCAVFALAKTFEVALSSRLLMGIAASPGIVSALYLAGRWFPPRHFALLAGMTEMIGMLGAAIGEPALSHVVDSSLGWRGAIWICVIAGVILLVMLSIFVRNQPQHANIAGSKSSHADKRSMFQLMKAIFCMPQAWVQGLYTGCMFTVVASFAALWCVPFIELRFHTSLPKASFAAAMIFWGTVGGTPLMGWLASVWDKRRLMCSTAVITAILLTVLLYTKALNYWEAVVLLFTIGLVASSYMLPFAVMQDIVPSEMQATAMGFTNMMCVMIGAPLLQPVIGMLLQWHAAHHLPLQANQAITYTLQDYQVALSILPICLGLAHILAYFAMSRLKHYHQMLATGRAVPLHGNSN